MVERKCHVRYNGNTSMIEEPRGSFVSNFYWWTIYYLIRAGVSFEYTTSELKITESYTTIKVNVG